MISVDIKNSPTIDEVPSSIANSSTDLFEVKFYHEFYMRKRSMRLLRHHFLSAYCKVGVVVSIPPDPNWHICFSLHLDRVDRNLGENWGNLFFYNFLSMEDLYKQWRKEVIENCGSFQHAAEMWHAYEKSVKSAKMEVSPILLGR